MTITLITGANKGLGYETARRLIGLGHTVLAGARNPQRGTGAARELGAAFLHVDPTDDASVAAAAARVRDEYGHLDVLINKCGHRRTAPGDPAAGWADRHLPGPARAGALVDQDRNRRCALIVRAGYAATKPARSWLCCCRLASWTYIMWPAS